MNYHDRTFYQQYERKFLDRWILSDDPLNAIHGRDMDADIEETD